MGHQPNEYHETLLHLHVPWQWVISWRGRWAHENRLAAVCQGGSFRPPHRKQSDTSEQETHSSLFAAPHLPCSEWNFPKLFHSCSAGNQNKWELTRTPPPSLSVGISIMLGNTWVWTKENARGHACRGYVLKTLLSMHYNILYNTEVKNPTLISFKAPCNSKFTKSRWVRKYEVLAGAVGDWLWAFQVMSKQLFKWTPQRAGQGCYWLLSLLSKPDPRP